MGHPRKKLNYRKSQIWARPPPFRIRKVTIFFKEPCRLDICVRPSNGRKWATDEPQSCRKLCEEPSMVS